VRKLTNQQFHVTAVTIGAYVGGGCLCWMSALWRRSRVMRSSASLATLCMRSFGMGWNSRIARAVVAVLVLGSIASRTSLAVGYGEPQAQPGAAQPPTGVGSCTLKNWNPNTDPDDAKDLPEGARPQTYKPDDYDCTGAVFAPDGVEFAQFPQPKNT